MGNKYGLTELTENELKECNGGFWWIVEVLAAGLTYELITEGFEKCAADFKAGYESTQKK
jgi:hypothetical protein